MLQTQHKVEMDKRDGMFGPQVMAVPPVQQMSRLDQPYPPTVGYPQPAYGQPYGYPPPPQAQGYPPAGYPPPGYPPSGNQRTQADIVLNIQLASCLSVLLPHFSNGVHLKPFLPRSDGIVDQSNE
ncbi:unnamed protein product [Ilex paraguariensis]|uniref:Rhodopsin n=1 Tax=Ilex paraguariensis TaxID=185542 RepID=A0ABC8S9H9_9AQUA